MLLTKYGVRYPKGARSIAKVAWHWLPRNTWQGRRGRGAEDRLLRVILAIPLAAEPSLTTMVEAILAAGRQSGAGDALLKLIFNHFACDAAFRDLPDLAFRVAEHLLGLNRSLEEVVANHLDYSTEAVSHAFGLNTRFSLDDFPASAFHGPYIRMLFHHPEGHILIGSSEPESDLQELIEKERPRSAAFESAMGLLHWGRSAFEGRAINDNWREQLLNAQTLVTAGPSSEYEYDVAAGGPAYVAAVCIRDHWSELSPEQQECCAQIICDAIEADADATEHLSIVALNPFEGSLPAAFAVSALFDKVLSSVTQAPFGRERLGLDPRKLRPADTAAACPQELEILKTR